MPFSSRGASRVLRLARRHSVALLALFLALGGTAAAVTARSGGGSRVYACVARDGEFTLSSAKKPCRAGQRKISWQGEGLRGAIGPAGPAGATGGRGKRGLQGPTGAQGLRGDSGPAGPQGGSGSAGVQGPKGDTGATGATGSTGAPGPPGINGTNGTNGIDGTNGTAGGPGPAGPGSFVSSSPVQLTTDVVGNPSQTALLPLSGVLDSSNTNPITATQAVPSAITFTGLRGRLTNSSAQLLVGTSLIITARLFHGAEGASSLVATSLACTAAPLFTGFINTNDFATFSCTGASVPFAAGDVGYVEISSQAGGSGPTTTLPGQATVSLAGS